MKKHLIVAGVILLVISPLMLNAMEETFRLLIASGVSSPEALSHNIYPSLFWSFFGIIVGVATGFLGLILLITGLVLKKPIKPTGEVGSDEEQGGQGKS